MVVKLEDKTAYGATAPGFFEARRKRSGSEQTGAFKTSYTAYLDERYCGTERSGRVNQNVSSVAYRFDSKLTHER